MISFGMRKPISVRDAITIGFPLVGGVLGFVAAVQFLKGNTVRGQAILAGWAVMTSMTETIEVYNQVIERRALSRIEARQTGALTASGGT